MLPHIPRCSTAAEHTFEAECREGHPRGSSPARIGEAPDALARVDDHKRVAVVAQVKLRDGDVLAQAVVPRSASTSVARMYRALMQGHVAGPASYREYKRSSEAQFVASDTLWFAFVVKSPEP